MNKRLYTFFLLVVILLTCSMPVFADDETSIDTEDNNIPDLAEVDVSVPAQVVVDITSLITPKEEDPDQEQSVQPVEVIEPVLISMEQTRQTVTPQDTNGLKAVLLTIIGDYETVVTDYTYQSGASQYYSHSINIERDWAWICSCGIFAILLYCTFRTIGGICARF